MLCTDPLFDDSRCSPVALQAGKLTKAGCDLIITTMSQPLWRARSLDHFATITCLKLISCVNQRNKRASIIPHNKMMQILLNQLPIFLLPFRQELTLLKGDKIHYNPFCCSAQSTHETGFFFSTFRASYRKLLLWFLIQDTLSFHCCHTHKLSTEHTLEMSEVCSDRELTKAGCDLSQTQQITTTLAEPPSTFLHNFFNGSIQTHVEW